MRALAIVAVLAAAAHADTVRIVVRDGGLAVARLRGQLADLDVKMRVVAGELEPTLNGQLDAAAKLADGAAAVVWFVPHDGGIAVAIATPGRLFVREIPAGDPSAVAEAAAIAARGAVRAILLGGTIGVALPPAVVDQPQPRIDIVPPAPPPPRAHVGLEAALGWQVALDGGADRGAQALSQRTAITRGTWAGSLALTLGVPMHRDGRAALQLARTGAAVGVERRFGSFAIGAFAGALLYQRATLSVPDGLMATPDASTIAFVAGPEVSYRWRVGHFGIAATAGLDLVAGAPDPVLSDHGETESVGKVRALQPRISLSIYAGLP